MIKRANPLRLLTATPLLLLTACLTDTAQKPYQMTEQEKYYAEKHCRSADNKTNFDDCMKEQRWAAESANKYFSSPGCCAPPQSSVTVNINR